MSTTLTQATIDRLNLLFSTLEQELVSKILSEECGRNLPLCNNATEADIERIRFAVLKLSEGKLFELKQAVQLAKEDWRDVLVAAGFGHSVTIHKDWWPDSSVS